MKVFLLKLIRNISTIFDHILKVYLAFLRDPAKILKETERQLSSFIIETLYKNNPFLF